jgi:hypothetical protein
VNQTTTVENAFSRTTSGFTALLASCCDSTGTVPIVQTLIELGAHLDATDDLSRTARDYAQIQDYREILGFLDSLAAPRGPSPETLG